MKRTLRLAFVIVFLLSMIISGCSSAPTSEPANNDQKQTAEKQNADDNKQEQAQDDQAASQAEDDVTNVDVTKITEFHQSPMLDSKGLPPVKDRLPKEPKLTNEEPKEFLKYEIGQYGGTLRTVTSQVDWDADVFVMNNEPLLNTPGILGKEITGNVLKSYEVSPDQKTFTFHMREGLKWSDGQPVTADDVKFAIDDVLFNKELTPILPSWLNSGGKATGKPMKFEPVDNYTFKISFDEPYGGFPIRLAIQGWRGYTDLLKPAHYLKQFHKKYADPKKLAAELKKAKYKPNEWTNLFNDKDITNWELTSSKAVGFPVLYPWVVKQASKAFTLYERNPYYFKIDAKGNQLPYIDQIKSTYVQDTEMVGLKTIAGEVDFSRETTALVKMPLYKDNAEKSGYKALLSKMHVTPTDIQLNLTNKDKNWRKVVQDVRFRQALSYATDRKEIADSLYYGFAEPGNIIDSTYDVDKANKLLDDMGMKMGSDGYRLGPDGKTFVIPFEIAAFAPDMVPLSELLVQQWKKIGIKVTTKTIDQALWGTRNDANELKATMMWTHTPLWYMGDWGQGLWGPLWNMWWQSGGKKGEEPPAEVKKLYTLIDEVSISPPDKAQEAIEKVKEEMKKNIWYLVHIGNVNQPLIVNAKLGNVTDKGYAIGANFSGEQFFFKK